MVVLGSEELGRLGWDVDRDGSRLLARWRGGEPLVEIQSGSPFLWWGVEQVQLAEAPFSSEDRFFLPLQFFIDILPWKLPEAFGYDPDTRTLEVLGSSEPDNGSATARKVVVIDPGHGGRDSGARGRGGTREKDLALSLGRDLARELEGDEELEIYLTRDEDVLIPLWKRGELATEWKGDGHGIFVSIHLNAMPNSRATRGFETYFLAEARTEHAMRTAALENAAQELELEAEQPATRDDLSGILSDLRNLDHQHWSSLLAEMVQEELARVHPGPNRRVKQGPFAVLTNALMPAVLIEIGFVTNPDEERLLSDPNFRREAVRAVATAIRRFFMRYPPGGVG
jgi:N-acetylmuramoyl-L-alanine amidase